MATERVITAAVDRAVETATVDEGEECRFDRDALADVIGHCSSGSGRDAVLAVVEQALQRWIDGLETERTLAAVALRTRIARATARRLVVVENLQGDVGTGSGSQS